MDFRLETILLPVADADRAKAFYADVLGWPVDVDHKGGETFRVVQVTPPGSACSITFGTGMPTGEPGSYGGLHLVVDDVEAALTDLRGRGVELTGPFHFGAEGRADGLHPERVDYGTYLSFEDPDGNGWLVQEVRSRAAA